MSTKIDFRLRKYLREMFFGDFESIRRGFKGYEIEEIRAFREGDPPEAINPRLSARRGQPMVRVTLPPSGLTAHMICDVSRSMRHKREITASIVEILADHLSDINAHFACSLVTTTVEQEIPAGSGDNHLRDTLRVIRLYFPREHQTSTAAFAETLRRIPCPPRLAFIITDLFVPEKQIYALSGLVAQHDTIFCVIRHPRDLKVRPLLFGATYFVDEETGEEIVGQIMKPSESGQILRQIGVDFAEFMTTDSHEKIIERFVALFEARRVGAGA